MSLIDTNAVIDSLQYDAPRRGAISVLTLLEILRGVTEGKRAELKTHLEDFHPVIGLDNDLVIEYCRLFDSLRTDGGLIPEADLIIAATATSKGLELETADQHFTRLQSHVLRLSVET
jgi:tRNA(fMet)-specific endonuclease VapC